MSKKKILITGIFVSFFLIGKTQINAQDSVIKTIRLYDSLIVGIDKSGSLQKRHIEGMDTLLKKFEGFAFLLPNTAEISKLDILVDSSNNRRVIVYMQKNKIISISIAGLKYYIINDNCFAKDEAASRNCNEILKSLPIYREMVKNFIGLFFEI